MRERDMRLRVERFLHARLRNMLMPATLGVGLALGGCASDGLSADDGGSTAKKDTAGKYDTSGPSVKYMAQVPDSGPIPVYSAAVPADAGPELPLAQPDYMAQMPADAGIGPVAVYSAPAPADSGIAVRYMAQMPDASAPLPMYMAPMLPENS
jgi:hypothetical protein